MYSSFSSATHHIFFPPRLQIVALKQDADGFPAHFRHEFSLRRFAGDQPHTPPCLALRRRTAHHGDDPLALACVQRPLLTRSRLFVQRLLQTFFLVAPRNGSRRLRRHTHIVGYLRRRQTFPYLNPSLFVGVLVDRVSKRSLLLMADSVRAVALIAAAALLMLGHMSVSVLCSIVCFISLFSLVFASALRAASPEFF